MKRISQVLIVLALTILIASQAMAYEWPLRDNIAEEHYCFESSSIKSLALTSTGGSVNISYGIYIDGVLVKTVTHTAAETEIYTLTFPYSDIKVDWTAASGTAAATLKCY